MNAYFTKFARNDDESLSPLSIHYCASKGKLFNTGTRYGFIIRLSFLKATQGGYLLRT